MLSFASLVLRIVSGEFEATHWALIVLVEPLADALLIEQVTTGQLGRLLCQVLTANRAARVFFVGTQALAVGVSDRYLWEVLDRVLAGRWCA